MEFLVIGGLESKDLFNNIEYKNNGVDMILVGSCLVLGGKFLLSLVVRRVVLFCFFDKF